jgi:copper oxidase (laccase) domain-containing protein
VALKGLEQMRREYGAESENVIAAIGPAAGACCYEVGTEVIDAFNSEFPNEQKLFTPTREGHACVDLLCANRNQLTGAGLKNENIFTAPLCTMCRTDLFFSYRREKTVHGRVGRLMSVVGRGEMDG